jgi:hypothetical protein
MTPFFRRLKLAFSALFGILLHDRIPAHVAAAMGQAPAAAAEPPPVQAEVDDQARAAQLLAILQRDGRILDFLMEDITPYADAQIGVAARDVHTGCRQVIERHLTLTPVIDREEGATVTVESRTDAATVRVIGNAAGQSPFRGVLRHRGWLATRIELPPLSAAGRMVIAPAEVEIP